MVLLKLSHKKAMFMHGMNRGLRTGVDFSNDLIWMLLCVLLEMFVAPCFQNMSEQEDSHKTPAKKKKKNGSVERKTYRCKVKYC